MKKYLKYLGYGFFTLFLYYAINLFMAILILGFDYVLHDEIYGGWETPRNSNVVITFFAVICVIYILILLGFFFLGRAFEFRNEKIICAFILFIIPNLALQILIYYSYSIELMYLLNWFLVPLENAFFFGPHNPDLRFSFFWNSVLTYFPFIFAFLGGLAKRKKNQRKLERELKDGSEF